jgi:transcriptional regulator with XRE-family HTH domain
MSGAFARRVTEGMRAGGLTLRSFCREVDLDPSFFSKVLSGKRSPPSEESVLRRIAKRLGLDGAELIVSAGRIPSEWRALAEDSQLFRNTHAFVVGEPLSVPKAPVRTRRPEPSQPVSLPSRHQQMSEELL